MCDQLFFVQLGRLIKLSGKSYVRGLLKAVLMVVYCMNMMLCMLHLPCNPFHVMVVSIIGVFFLSFIFSGISTFPKFRWGIGGVVIAIFTSPYWIFNIIEESADSIFPSSDETSLALKVVVAAGVTLTALIVAWHNHAERSVEKIAESIRPRLKGYIDEKMRANAYVLSLTVCDWNEHLASLDKLYAKLGSGDPLKYSFLEKYIDTFELINCGGDHKEMFDSAFLTLEDGNNYLMAQGVLIPLSNDALRHLHQASGQILKAQNPLS